MGSTYKSIGNNLKARQKRLAPERKRWAIQKLGGQCSNCSTTSDLTVKPKIIGGKTFGGLWGHSSERLEREIANYIILCESCSKLRRYPPKIKSVKPRKLMAIDKGNTTHIRKEKQLGMKWGTATHRLRRKVMWQLIADLGNTNCYRCLLPMSEETYSIEHKKAWLDVSTDLFWDTDNISFSHLRCNLPNL